MPLLGVRSPCIQPSYLSIYFFSKLKTNPKNVDGQFHGDQMSQQNHQKNENTQKCYRNNTQYI